MVNGKFLHFVQSVKINFHYYCCWFFLTGLFCFIELPSDFAEMQEEIERQKAALLDKTKRKETVEASGNK